MTVLKRINDLLARVGDRDPKRRASSSFRRRRQPIESQLSLPLPADVTGGAARHNGFVPDWLVASRRSVALLGVLAAGGAAALGEAPGALRLAFLAFISFSAAVSLGWVEYLLKPRAYTLVLDEVGAVRRRGSWVIFGVAVVAALGAQSWFRWGTVIAGGDVAPPLGTAWISRLSSAWAWSGWNLGGPSTLELQLPWAVVLGSTHIVGASPELAQRIWFSGLFVCALVAAVAVLLVLGLRLPAACIGALAYVFSPFVVANVLTNPVYLAALLLLPAMPAIVLAGARRQIPARSAIALFALSGPMLGYVYQNPPLLGMVLATALCAPLVGVCVYGGTVGRRAVLLLGLGLLACLAVSAYWIIPSALQLSAVAKGQLATISSWSWTEGRATILNALWLNTAWGWKFPEYYPFASTYDSFPLSFMRFWPAVLAFVALAIRRRVGARGEPTRMLPLTVIAGTVALLLILLSTGTNSPGNLIFDPLYALPFGWLLREPGRFLMLADLMYAILIAITVETLLAFRWHRQLSRAASSLRIEATTLGSVALLVILPGFPLFTGAIVPDTRPILPSSHVHVPTYWAEMGAFVDTAPVSGGVLVLPPDDFYQMPYRWGYYGNDEFIPNLMSRRVLIPSSQAYVPPTAQLLSTIDLIAKSILSGNSTLTDRLLRVLGAPLVLVRGDLDLDLAKYYGRNIASPAALGSALQRSPYFDLIHTSGPLELFALHGVSIPDTEVAPYYATVNNSTPDLRVLSKLPQGAALVSEQPITGVPLVQEPPPLSTWRRSNNSLVWNFPEVPGWTYELTSLDSTSGPNGHGVTVTHQSAGTGNDSLEISVPVIYDLEAGAFTQRDWGPVGSCGIPGTGPLTAAVQPNGGPHGGAFLQLTARGGSACVTQPLQWHGGSLVVSMSARHVTGALPRICLWETGPERCAPLPVVADAEGWTTFAAAATPDPGTTAIRLYLYADVYVPGTLTASDYADVQVVEVQELPQVDLIGTPVETSGFPWLMLHHSSFSPDWRGPEGSHQVMVDGLMNGWQIRQPQPVSPQYLPAYEVNAGLWISALSVAAILGLALSLWDWRRASFRLLAGWNSRDPWFRR